MTEYAQITGKTLDNKIQVRLKLGTHLYAPLMVVGTSSSMPSESWISEHKGEYLALVTYEGKGYNNPLILGFYPVKGNSTEKANTHEKLIRLFERTVKLLQKAKVNTSYGAQTFTPDALMELEDIQGDLETMMKDINAFEL